MVFSSNKEVPLGRSGHTKEQKATLNLCSLEAVLLISQKSTGDLPLCEEITSVERVEATCFHLCTELGCLGGRGCSGGQYSCVSGHFPSLFTIFHSACVDLAGHCPAPKDSSRKSSCQCVQGHLFSSPLLIWHTYRLMVKVRITHPVHPIPLLCWI